jgi:hypothetical protein
VASKDIQIIFLTALHAWVLKASATELDLGMPTACWSGLQLCFKRNPKKKLVTELKMLGQNIQTWFSKF